MTKLRPTNSEIGAVAAATVICIMLIAVPARAVDGEIFIDQAAVNAGGISPGDAPGFPATLSRSGRYKLTGNLRVPSGTDGIEVTARDVTVDLNGFTIASATLHDARYGVVSSLPGLRVMNGTVTGFGSQGIFQQTGGRGSVENMRVLSNGTGGSGSGVYLFDSSGQVRNGTIANNVFGIFCAYGCLIEQNSVTNNTAVGILIAGGLVIGNVIVGNTGVGLAVDNVDKAGYGNNVLVGNNGGGAQVNGANAVQVHPNVCDPACP